MTVIVQEMPEHYDAVRQLTIDAFASSGLGHNGEADLVEAIREQCEKALALVAINNDRVVGHILFSPATIHTELSIVHGMALAPMAVLPAQQRRGIGGMLVTDGLRRLDESKTEFVIVAGHVNYYPRFGFLRAQDLSIVHGFEGLPQELLFIHVNNRKRAVFSKGGLAYFHNVFGPQHVG